jgi:hypothetical protein
MASFNFNQIPESNNNINFDFNTSNKCSKCKDYYGVLVNNVYLCSKCSGLMAENLYDREKDVLTYANKYKILDKRNFMHFRLFCNKLKNMYSEGSKITIPLLCIFLRKYIYLMLSGNFQVHDNWAPIFTTVNDDEISKIKEKKLVYLFNLKQCEEILKLFRGESFQDKFHQISNCMARYLKFPWKQSNIFHPSSSCYHGNFGEPKYCNYEKFYDENHFGKMDGK